MLAAVAVVVMAGWQMVGHTHDLLPPRSFSPAWLLLAIAAQAGVSMSNTLLAHGHLKLHGHEVPLMALLRINLWGSLLNLVMPVGLGMLLRGAWLHARHQVTVTGAGRHLLETNLIVFAVNLWLLVLIVAIHHGAWPLGAAATLGALAIACLPHVRRLTARALLPYPCAALLNVAIAQGINLHLPPDFLLTLPLLIHASALVVLAPGALAVTESLSVLAAVAWGAPVGDALWLALVARITGLIAVAAMLLAFQLMGRVGKEKVCRS